MGLGSVLRHAPRLLTLGWDETTDLVRAQTALLRARRSLSRRPVGTLLRPARRAAGLPDPEVVDRLERLAVAVRRTAEHGLIRATCLVRALALEDLADRIGCPAAVVRVGVRRDDGEFAAHAWLEVDGRIVGDTLENVKDFQVLEDFSSL